MTARSPGDLLDGRYQLTERIGSGGMGTVYRAHDMRLDRTVAIKLLHHGQEVDDVTRARLQAEARFAGALQHPGIVQVFDYGEEPGDQGSTPYVVMQYVEGTPVSEVLRERGALPPETVAALLDDVAQALVVAHAAGVVHRDLKPSNLLVTESGRAVLVDFGVARSDTAEPLTETGQIIGSADYLSPEQVRGQRATPASDIYALGIVAHQCLSATSPFRRETQAATLLARLHDEAPELGPQVPATMRGLVTRMMSPEPEARPTAVEVARQVATLDQQPTVMLPPAGPIAAHATPWDRRRLVAIVVAAVLLLTIGGLVMALQGDDTTPPAASADLVVPTVQGEQVAQATTELRAAGFDVVRRVVDGPTVRGKVLHQSPRPGPYSGDDPARVVIRVSSGWTDIDSDDLLGTAYAAAASAVGDLGLASVRVDQPSTGLAGTVLAVDLDGRVRVGSTVTLTAATAQVVAPPTPAAHHVKKPRAPKPGKPNKPGKPHDAGKKKH